MKKIIGQWVILFLVIGGVSLANADEVYLKSGRVVKGKIIAETEESIQLENSTFETAITYYRDEIDKIKKGEVQTDNVQKNDEPRRTGDFSEQQQVAASVNDEKEVLASSAQHVSKSVWVKKGRGGKKTIFIESSPLGKEDVEVAGRLFKECLKKNEVEKDTDDNGSYDLSDCTVWTSAEGMEILRECSSKSYDKKGVLAETSTDASWMMAGKVDGKLIGEKK